MQGGKEVLLEKHFASQFFPCLHQRLRNTALFRKTLRNHLLSVGDDVLDVPQPNVQTLGKILCFAILSVFLPSPSENHLVPKNIAESFAFSRGRRCRGTRRMRCRLSFLQNIFGALRQDHFLLFFTNSSSTAKAVPLLPQEKAKKTKSSAFP